MGVSATLKVSACIVLTGPRTCAKASAGTASPSTRDAAMSPLTKRCPLTRTQSPGAQRWQLARLQRHAFLAQNLKLSGCRIHRTERPHHGIDHGNTARGCLRAL